MPELGHALQLPTTSEVMMSKKSNALRVRLLLHACRREDDGGEGVPARSNVQCTYLGESTLRHVVHLAPILLPIDPGYPLR